MLFSWENLSIFEALHWFSFQVLSATLHKAKDFFDASITVCWNCRPFLYQLGNIVCWKDEASRQKWFPNPNVTEEWLADWKHLPHLHVFMYSKFCRAVVTQFICRGPQCQPTMAVAARQRREEKLEFEKVQIGDTPINFPFTPYPLQVPHSHKHPLPHLLLNLKTTAY